MKKQRLVVTLAIALILVQTLALVSAEVVVNPPTFFEKILKSLSESTFTIVGQDNHASVYKDESWDVSSGLGFSIGKDYTNSLCNGNSGFYNVWARKNGILYERFETIDELDFTCNSLNDNCYIELYCMPYLYPPTESSCDSWGTTKGYSPNQVSVATKTATDSLMPLQNLYGQPINTYTYCKVVCTGNSITCWQAQSTNCVSRSYDCSYSTYPNCPTTWPYTSLSQCQANLPSNYCGDGTCDNNEACDDCPADCGNCNGGGGEIGKSDIRVTKSVIGPDFASYQGIDADRIGKFELTLKNFGTEKGTINVEAGFYSNIYAKEVSKLFSIGLFSVVKDQPNCKPEETFIQTKQVTLDPGESKQIEFQVSIKNAFVTYLEPGEYDLRTEKIIGFWGLYKSCCEIQSDGTCKPGTGGYINDAGTTGKGVMFDYQELDVVCSSWPFKDTIYCDGEKVGYCRGNTFYLEKVCESIANLALEVQSEDINDLLDDYGDISTNKFTDLKKVSLTKEEISKATTQDLLLSSCLSSSECLEREDEEGNKFSTSCIKLDKLNEDGVITDSQKGGFLSDAKSIVQNTVLGAGVGAATALTLCAIPSIPTAGLALIPCTAIGAILGGTVGATVLDDGIDKIKDILNNDDDLVKAIKSGDSKTIGICTAEKGFDLCVVGKYLPITKNCTYDGIILIGGGIFILFMLLSVLGGKR